jgi:hypothetical protein
MPESPAATSRWRALREEAKALGVAINSKRTFKYVAKLPRGKSRHIPKRAPIREYRRAMLAKRKERDARV